MKYHESLRDTRRADLEGALAGVRLTGRDGRYVGWFSRLDRATVSVLCDLIRRAREAGPLPDDTAEETAR